MKVSLHPNPLAPHHQQFMSALADGINSSGDVAVFLAPNEIPDPDVDVAVIWSLKQREIMGSGKRLLIMERGFLPDRNSWVSIGWDGMNGDGVYAEQVNGKKRSPYFESLVKPYRKLQPDKKVLLIGQVPKDPSLGKFDIFAWLDETAAELAKFGLGVRFRPHPAFALRLKEKRPGMEYAPLGVDDVSDSLKLSLEEDAADSNFVVSYCSNSAVETVLNGHPTVAMGKQSMAYEVCSHSLDPKKIITPDRSSWLERLAWCQFKERELRDGSAWGYLKRVMKKN